MVTGKVHSFESLGAVDGPGLRLVVFLQGCPARCKYCHNPDTWSPQGGQEVGTEDILQRAKRGLNYYGDKGGVTFSGGEPLLQGAFLREALLALKEAGIHTAIDTSGTYVDEFTDGAVDACQLVLLDVKHTQPEGFRDLTGRGQETLLQLIDLINKYEKPVWVRQVIIPGLNDTEADIVQLNQFIQRIHRIEKVELLGYHSMGAEKYEALGIPYSLKKVLPLDGDVLKQLQSKVIYGR
ncbi:pyruvate formate lyase-activating protein [Aminipila butyrica]|uniref:Pyruvate formate-lyase-activating enzyme n=1 Tax=Aminipila butyrica TaxID=433296 RepID=A0A858BYC1_9FIRM|nr:pyruvate formate-lyase-activating protein [Aminipila butyrica]QIB70125.1 pyruvate formate lyase-activating protein [Aminipila butyrica]